MKSPILRPPHAAPSRSRLLTAFAAMSLLVPLAAGAAGREVFHGVASPTVHDPVIHVENHSASTLTVQFRGPAVRELAVAPHEREAITVAPGAYGLTISVPSAPPITGSQRFLAGHEYSAAFKIETRYVPR